MGKLQLPRMPTFPGTPSTVDSGIYTYTQPSRRNTRSVSQEPQAYGQRNGYSHADASIYQAGLQGAYEAVRSPRAPLGGSVDRFMPLRPRAVSAGSLRDGLPTPAAQGMEQGSDVEEHKVAGGGRGRIGSAPGRSRERREVSVPLDFEGVVSEAIINCSTCSTQTTCHHRMHGLEHHLCMLTHMYVCGARLIRRGAMSAWVVLFRNGR